MGLNTDLWIDDVRDTLYAFHPLQGLEQDLPGHTLAAATGAHHHQTVVDVGDLVQLKYLQPEINTILTHLDLQQTGAHHHQTVVDVGDLVQLKYLQSKIQTINTFTCTAYTQPNIYGNRFITKQSFEKHVTGGSCFGWIQCTLFK